MEQQAAARSQVKARDDRLLKLLELKRRVDAQKQSALQAAQPKVAEPTEKVVYVGLVGHIKK